MNIVFIMVCPFPYGSASSIRAVNLCRMVHDAGHKVHVISDFSSASPVSDGGFGFCTYEAAHEAKGNFIDRNISAIKSMKRLEAYCSSNKVDAVIANARYDRFASLIRICRKHKAKLIVENCEWYDHSNFKLGFADYRFILNQWMITRGFRKADAFISISRFLDEHNRTFGISSVRIPTVMDVQTSAWRKNADADREKVRIVYTGNCGISKEYLRPMIEVLAQDKGIRDQIEFHIYGPSKATVIRNIGGDEALLEKAGSSVLIHGSVPQTEIENVLKDADFQFFLRPDRRSSHAGFPTKLGESMCVGTPVVANQTGDIELYLKNTYNGYLLNGISVCEVKAAIKHILELNAEQKTAMRMHARKTAEEAFDYRVYTKQISKLIGEQL